MSRPVKRRRISPPLSNANLKGTSTLNSAFAKSPAKWNLEQTYEQRPRKLNKEAVASKLPIRTEEGWVEQERSQASESDAADSFPAAEEDFDASSTEGGEIQRVVPTISSRQQILEAKEELARLANLVNEDPEEHIGSLRTIAAIGESANITIKKLALATQLTIYKDIIPGYRIRPYSDEDSKVKLSKEVRQLRNFEQSLVGGYQQYLQLLSDCVKQRSTNASEEETSLANVAISCACNLLLAVPHFNFRGELLKMLLGKMSGKSRDSDFYKCAEALEILFRTDEDGNASLEAVTLLTKMIKAKNYLVDEAVLNTFLQLRLLSEFSQKGSHAGVDKDAEQQEPKSKKQIEKREFRTKKQRKALREQKVIEKEMKEADAAVSHEERDRMQAETLKLVFVTYFRILKARTPSLMGAVLEGLAHYAHLINQDFFGDILEALKDLISQVDTQADDNDEEDEASKQPEDEQMRNVSRESLLCVITAFALLQGQDTSVASASLNLDLNFFITHLYRTLFPACLNPDIELSAKSLRLPDPHAPPSDQKRTSSTKVNVQTTAVLLIRSLSSALLPQANTRAVPPTRVAAFAKNLMTASLQLPEKSSLAMLGLLQRVVKVHGRKMAALWHTEERKGDGGFDALRGEGGGEGSNPFATTVWEGELLRRHFCPGVRDAIKTLEKAVLDSR